MNWRKRDGVVYKEIGFLHCEGDKREITGENLSFVRAAEFGAREQGLSGAVELEDGGLDRGREAVIATFMDCVNTLIREKLCCSLCCADGLCS